MLELLDDALNKGAQVLTGATPHALGGNFFTPTVLGNVQPGSLLLEEEIFGPVARRWWCSMTKPKRSAANDTIYGWPPTSTPAMRAHLARFGAAGVRHGRHQYRPYLQRGAVRRVKQSGTGREGSEYGIEDYLELKYLCRAV